MNKKKFGIAVINIQNIHNKLVVAFPERGQLISGSLTALLAGEHVLMLGPPGTAKSLFARTLSGAVAKKSFFEILLTKFTSVEEVFGPVSFKGLKEDRFERILDGYAASRSVVFLDEIFKSSSAILNCMLTLMNERVFHNGGVPIKTPLEMIFAASNEYPQDESLKALFDRFSFKFWVDYIGDNDALANIIAAGGIGSFKASLNDWDLEILRDAVKGFDFTRGNIDVLLKIKSAVENEGFVASDRTWVKCAKIVSARAVLAGRDSVISSDWMILSNVLWQEHKDRERLHGIIGNAADPYGSRAEAIHDAISTSMRALPDISLLKSGTKTKTEMVRDITAVSQEVTSRRDAFLELVDESKQAESDFPDTKLVVDSSMKQIQDLLSEVTFFRAPRS